MAEYIFLIAFGVLPSLIWLAFYMYQDDHPEPRRMILKIFFWGALSTIPALLLERGFCTLFGVFNFTRSCALSDTFIFAHKTFAILYVFIGIAFVEELMKFFIVRFKIYSNKELDEPVDLVMYMVISALGFSAFENILVMFGLGDGASLNSIATVSIIRLLGATFLHALASSILGYFLALSFFYSKHRTLYTSLGFALATLLHGFFDFTILAVDGSFRFWGPFLIFILTILFILFAIAHLKRMKSVCTI